MKNTFLYQKEKNTYHLLDSSPLPIITAFSALLFVLSIIFYWNPSTKPLIQFIDNIIFHFSVIFFIGILFTWFIFVVIESGLGYHTKKVRTGLRTGMLLFIVSEVLFFFAFFWGFFHVSLSPSIAIGCIWPPVGIASMDIWGLPLYNTLLLLNSGLTLTIAHRALVISGNYSYNDFFSKFLIATINYGIIFLICQYIEYKYGILFSWKENIYGTTFFVTTGFHGFHVTIGIIFLLFCFVRSLLTTSNFTEPNSIYMVFFTKVNKYLNLVPTTVLTSKILHLQEIFGFTKYQHLGFEAAAWYWHFVDVVWLFLFLTIYWWGN